MVHLKFPVQCAMASSLGGPGMTTGVPPPRIVNLEFPPPPPYPPPHNQVNFEMRIINFANDAHSCVSLLAATVSEVSDFYEKIHSYLFTRISIKRRNIHNA